MKEIQKAFIYILTIIPISAMTIGCKPLKNLSSNTYTIDSLQKTDFSKLNGIYKNSQDTVFGKIIHKPENGMGENDLTLLERFFIILPDKGNHDDITVKIEFFSKNTAHVSTCENGQILDTKKLRGGFKNGYFYVRPKWYFIPFFPANFGYNFKRVRIGKIDDDIIVDQTVKIWGKAHMVTISDSGRITSIYRSVK